MTFKDCTYILTTLAIASFALVVGVRTQPSNEIIKETGNGVLWFGGNELRADARDLDAAKVRVGSRLVAGQHGGGGAYSFDLFNDIGGRRVEAAVLTGSFNGHTGEVGLSIWNGRDYNDIRDADQIKAVEFTSQFTDFKTPVRFSGGILGGTVASSTWIRSGNGQVLLAVQDDGNLVLYVDGVPVKALFGLPADQLW